MMITISIFCRSIAEVSQIPMPGFVNSLDFSQNGPLVLVAGLGQEHRLGRWWRDKKAKNKLAIIHLNKL